MNQEKIGIFISTLRKEQGLTQQQLAEAIGVSNKTISKWECGRGMPELALIVPLCHILHTNINEFLSGVNSNPRIPFVTQDSLFVNENPVL